LKILAKKFFRVGFFGIFPDRAGRGLAWFGMVWHGLAWLGINAKRLTPVGAVWRGKG
jgi:hypothetical protein